MPLQPFRRQGRLELPLRAFSGYGAGSGGHFERGCDRGFVGIRFLGGVGETDPGIFLTFGHILSVPSQAG